MSTISSLCTDLARPAAYKVLVTCPLCQNDLGSRACNQSHLKSRKVKGKAMYSCQLCNFSSTIRRSATVHVRTHTGERPYQCLICPSNTVSMRGIWSHLIRGHRSEYKSSLTGSDVSVCLVGSGQILLMNLWNTVQVKLSERQINAKRPVEK